jgi:hypothetical protein
MNSQNCVTQKRMISMSFTARYKKKFIIPDQKKPLDIVGENDQWVVATDTADHSDRAV